jgi:hypothetical protein
MRCTGVLRGVRGSSRGHAWADGDTSCATSRRAWGRDAAQEFEGSTASGAGRTFEPQMGIATGRERDRVHREGMRAGGPEGERARRHQDARGAGAAAAVGARRRTAAGLVGLAAVIGVGNGVALVLLAARIDHARHAGLLEPEGEDQQQGDEA